MICCIWVFENPWFSKNAMTESGLSGVLKRRYLEAAREDCWEKPNLSIRKPMKHHFGNEINKLLRERTNSPQKLSTLKSEGRQDRRLPKLQAFQFPISCHSAAIRLEQTAKVIETRDNLIL
ncbi:hypothetical protein QQP08_012969 [Theobroma cacao]|nr:hypothetical protein QQP08_012969 [Theobroma cacao]